MRIFGSRYVFATSSMALLLGVVVACSTGQGVETSSERGQPSPGASNADSITIPFPGAGNAGQSQLLSAGFTPNACAVAGPAATFDGGAMQVAGPDRVTCYFSSASPGTPMAFLEQIVETAQGQGLIHVRLTMNPAFVDNTYGDQAIGWGGSDSGTAPATSPAGGPTAGGPGSASQASTGPASTTGPMSATGTAPATGPASMTGAAASATPAAMVGGPAAAAAGPMGPGGHTFTDLVQSDHAEFDLTNSAGATSLSFDLDYISADTAAPSGYATLGVSGGDGRMLTGDAAAIVYASTSLDRDLNACGYGSYTTDSPATDASYTPNAATPNWDYRVVYDVWVQSSAFAGGFGVATIPYVHASPAKLSATLPVTPGPCPPPLGDCDGGDCDAGDGGPVCVGEGCLGNSNTCFGEFCEDAGYSIPR